MHNTLEILTGSLQNPLAHAGHGTVDANNPAHYVTTPEHLVAAVAVIALVAVTTWLATRSAYRISKPT